MGDADNIEAPISSSSNSSTAEWKIWKKEMNILA